MITRLLCYYRKKKSAEFIYNHLLGYYINIAVYAYVHETQILLLDILSKSNKFTIFHLENDFNYNRFDNTPKHEYRHVYLIPSIEPRFTNYSDLVFHQTDISSFTIIKDCYSPKGKGTIVYV